MWPLYLVSDLSQHPTYRNFVCLSHFSSSSDVNWDYYTTFTLQRGSGAEWKSCCAKTFPMKGNILLYSLTEHNLFRCCFSVCGRRSSTNSTQCSINTTQLSIHTTLRSINTTQCSIHTIHCSNNTSMQHQLNTMITATLSISHTDPASAGGKSFGLPPALSFETRIQCQAGSGVSPTTYYGIG